MTVAHQHFRLSPNLVDRLRAGLAQETFFYSSSAVLDSCDFVDGGYSFDNQKYSLLAGYSNETVALDVTFLSGREFQPEKRWYFGHLNYELKDFTEKGLFSTKPAITGFKKEGFFAAQIVFRVQNLDLEIITYDGSRPEEHYQRIISLASQSVLQNEIENVQLLSKEDYLSTYSSLQQHLQRGDIYEINYCLPFRAYATAFNPVETWLALNKKNPAPFSALYRRSGAWLLCSSPERFLRKTGKRIISQPIKGTLRRGSTEAEDKRNAELLQTNEKERAENIMITDLVRNDLSKIAVKGSVKVEELCGLHAFKNVFQLISTISAELKQEVTLQDILKATFPMGSMTGAPKFRAMQLIESHEIFRRELYSGSVGYISPEGDFDFNVVIRSILYNQENGVLLLPAGSAITAKSDANLEYDECILKATALLTILEATTNA